jgi:hypothetical protein
MSDRTLLLPSAQYDAGHERLRNRRIEEVMRRSEMHLNDQLRAQFIPACKVSELPATRAGVRGFVVDATANTFGAAVVGGGSVNVPV